MQELESVLFANEAFYAAFATGDVDAMEDLWMTGRSVSCIHPGWNAMHGRDIIMKTWRDILKEESPEVRCMGAEAYLATDNAAVVTCYELVGKSVLAATNIFVRDGNRWRIVHHQAGPATVAMQAETTPGKNTIN
ncbi:MAG: nuclear transport factor 2 family protein [Magnetospiraceae bacterium]